MFLQGFHIGDFVRYWINKMYKNGLLQLDVFSDVQLQIINE